MARSQQTSGKKENEKRKQSKRKDKAQRREDRKANSDKGKTLEDMLVYVDEFGQLSSTAPDPLKRKMIDTADIQIGVPKRAEADSTNPIREGVVTFFNESKGYGFIRDLETQQSVFVHANECEQPVRENDKVTFEIQVAPRGPIAVKVKAKQA